MRINLCTQKIIKLNQSKKDIKNNYIGFKNEKDSFTRNNLSFRGKSYSPDDIKLAKKTHG